MLAIVIPTMSPSPASPGGFAPAIRAPATCRDFEYSGQLELVVWSIPTLTVMLLAGVIWVGSHDLDPAMPIGGKGKPITIQVVSLDWKWLFLYPDQKIASVNELVAPVGAPLHFQITSGSVMSAFFVPQWGSMIYGMNGMTTQLYLRADQAGETRGYPPDHRRRLLRHAFQGARRVARGFRQLGGGRRRAAPRSTTRPITSWRNRPRPQPSLHPLAEPNLFDDIVRQKLPPGPGPKPALRPTSVVD